jgi:1,4-dihydroxy-2-naphthoyl-CoA hydrolase
MESTPDSPRPPSAFMEAAGLVLDDVQSARVTSWIDLGPEHHQPWGLVHGGVYTTAIESAASIGASTAASEYGLIAVGVNNNTNFLRSKTEGRVMVHAHADPTGQVTTTLGSAHRRRARPPDRDRTGPPPEHHAARLTPHRSLRPRFDRPRPRTFDAQRELPRVMVAARDKALRSGAQHLHNPLVARPTRARATEVRESRHG